MASRLSINLLSELARSCLVLLFSRKLDAGSFLGRPSGLARKAEKRPAENHPDPKPQEAQECAVLASASEPMLGRRFFLEILGFFKTQEAKVKMFHGVPSQELQLKTVARVSTRQARLTDSNAGS